jgi:type IV pilus assembly protein PilY1
MTSFFLTKSHNRTVMLYAAAFVLTTVPGLVAAVNTIAQVPLFVTSAVPPKVLINLSKDHQLSFKAFDDYSDIDGDGVIDTTYKQTIDYYGYFDPYKCYNYTSNNMFEPQSISADKYCKTGGSAGEWSGNFLNWATMSRMDAVRLILYGGKRFVDTPTQTVLQRAYIPTDAHSWAKFYNGSDIGQLTPYTWKDGITLCNTSDAPTGTAPSGTSQTVTYAPLIRIAEGNYSLWAANERFQCRWLEDLGLSTSSSGTAGSQGTNGNIPASSGLSANPLPPSHGGTSSELVARLTACVSTALIGQEVCQPYAGNQKPVGLLQQYGANGKMNFGLMTGSYEINKDGGVLRKNIGPFNDEINADGTFTGSAPTAGGIINTLNLMRIVGYQYGSSYGLYNNAQPDGDGCPWALSSFNNGICRDWGNPQAELFLESLRYLAGKPASTTFVTDDTVAIAGLTTASVVDPYKPTDQCAATNIIHFNASTTSYDADNLSQVSDIGLSSLTTLNNKTDKVGTLELVTGNYFIGNNGITNDQLCTAKSVSATSGQTNSLSKLLGTCPDAPRLSGSYQIVGLASYANQTDLRKDIAGVQTATVYGVALSPKLPKAVIPVPGSTTGATVTILPACRNLATPVPTNCAIVDFKIISETSTASAVSGSLYVNWEDSEQGGDFDQDQWGIIKYSVTSSQVTITTDVIAQSTPNAMGFGYIIGGTNKDGFHVHSGINGFNYTDTYPGVTGCSNCLVGNSSTSMTYNIGITNASSLEQPLYYAAKWGGFIDSDGSGTPNLQSEWDVINNLTGSPPADGIPDTYFAATNPQVLKQSLNAAFSSIAEGNGSSSSVATNSTTLVTGSIVYQAQFNPVNWSGNLLAFDVNPVTAATTKDWSTFDAGRIPAAASRNIVTYDPVTNSGALFQWVNLTCPASATTTTVPGVCTQTTTTTKKGKTTTTTTTVSSCTGKSNCSCTPPTTSSIPIATCQSANVQNDGNSQQDYLNKLGSSAPDTNGSLRLNWLRGDQTLEQQGSTDTNKADIFRQRTVILGDIVNSDPIFTYTEDFGYGILPGVLGSSYTTFVAGKSSRTPMVYVGANDGMLHGFDARANVGSVTTGGDEIFAYIPNALYSQLSNLASPAYNHQYYVDGATAIGDAYFNNNWHTVAVGTTAAGGRAAFALDVSNPSGFSASNVLWEFTTSPPPTTAIAPNLDPAKQTNCSAWNSGGFTSTTYDANDLGYTLAQPTIVNLHNGTSMVSAVVLANGYNSNNGHAVLFILEAGTGCVIKKIDTGIGPNSTSPARTDDNGLSTPAAVDTTGDSIIDYIYAGDLYGNLWKFDMTSTAPSSWTIAGGKPLFVACASAGATCSVADTQPITVKPTIGPVGPSDQVTGRMVYFGTGTYFQSTDSTIPTATVPQTETMYGIWDKSDTTFSPISDRAKLEQQQILDKEVLKNSTGDLTIGAVTINSQNPVCYIASSPGCTTSSTLQLGWYLDLLAPNPISPQIQQQGERIVSPASLKLSQGLVVFTSLTPDPNPCEQGGQSTTFELNMLTGGAPTVPPFAAFAKTGTTPGIQSSANLVINASGKAVVASGVQMAPGIYKNPVIIQGKSIDAKFASTSKAGLPSLIQPCSGCSNGNGGSTPSSSRTSWRQLR